MIETLNALAEPNRLAIVELLKSGPRPVGDIVAELGLRQPLVSKHLAYQLDSYRRHMVEGTGRPTPRPVDPEKIRKVDPNSPPLSSFLYGTPEEFAATVIASTAGTPVDTVFIWASLGGAPDELTAQHVHTICTRLRPLLADA